MSDYLTQDEMDAIAIVVARLTRGRGTGFNAGATLVRFGKLARSHIGFRIQVQEVAARVRSCADSTIDWELRRLEQTADEIMASMRTRARRASKTRTKL